MSKKKPFVSIDFDTVVGTPADRWRVWIEGLAPAFLSNVYTFLTKEAAIRFTETNCYRVTTVLDLDGGIVLESDGKPFKMVFETRDDSLRGYSTYLVDPDQEEIGG